MRLGKPVRALDCGLSLLERGREKDYNHILDSDVKNSKNGREGLKLTWMEKNMRRHGRCRSRKI